MFVRNHMTKSPITINKKTSVFEALEMMKKYNIRQLPVVAEGKLAGIVTQKGLLTISPSPATSLSIFELNYMLAQMTVAEAMAKKILTVTSDTTIEEAALLLRKHKIRSVPVVEGDVLVGIITVTDIFDALAKYFGYGKSGARLVIESRNRDGLVADVTQAVNDLQIPLQGIISVLKDNDNIEILLRLGTFDAGALVDTLNSRGIEVTNVSYFS